MLVVKAQMPAQQQLPEALWGLSCRQAIELTDTNWDHDLERLAAAIESAPGGPSRRRRTSGRRPIPVPALAIIAVVVLGLVVQGVRVLMSGESGPSRMTGWFNIAVADFEVLDSGGKVVSSAVAAQLDSFPAPVGARRQRIDGGREVQQQGIGRLGGGTVEQRAAAA